MDLLSFCINKIELEFKW